MKEYSDCDICEKPFWIKDLKRVTLVDPRDDKLKAPSFICKKCKKDMDGMHDSYLINTADGPEI